jgi:hypothetical protein
MAETLITAERQAKSYGLVVHWNAALQLAERAVDDSAAANMLLPADVSHFRRHLQGEREWLRRSVELGRLPARG